MCVGANISENASSNIERCIIPLKMNITDGIIERANALNRLFFFQHTIHIIIYIATSVKFTIKYARNAL